MLPTESTYEMLASALHPEAVAMLRDLTSAPQDPAVVLHEFAEVFDWLPLLSGAALRILRKLGTQGIALQANAGCSSGLMTRLPEAARRLIMRDGLITVRWPTHEPQIARNLGAGAAAPTGGIWREVARAPAPLVAISLRATNADDAAKLVGNRAACVVDAGPSQHARLPSIVRAEGRRCQMVQEGILSGSEMEDWTACRILFICTGNTCRSPMAAALCKKLLAEHCGCVPDQLPQCGFHVQSAGLAAMMGNEASPDAVRAGAELGAELSGHRSSMADMDMLERADHIFTMTASHWYALQGVPTRARLLSPQNEDLVDPIGGELADYRACARQIHECLMQRLPEILES